MESLPWEASQRELEQPNRKGLFTRSRQAGTSLQLQLANTLDGVVCWGHIQLCFRHLFVQTGLRIWQWLHDNESLIFAPICQHISKLLECLGVSWGAIEIMPSWYSWSFSRWEKSEVSAKASPVQFGPAIHFSHTSHPVSSVSWAQSGGCFSSFS